MDTTLAWVIGGVLVVLIVWALVMGRRFGKAKVKLGKSISAELEAPVGGPRVADAEAFGKKNTITAEGEGAVTERVKAVGDENTIGAKTRRS
jgi:hypothetical protein